MTKAKGIGRRTVSGISWTLFGSIASNLLRVGVVASLGRLLTDVDFGVVAAAMTVILFASRVKEIGIGLALVQRETITREHVEATFAFQLLLGLTTGAIVFLAAGPLARTYHMPQAENPIRVLSALFLMRGLSSTSQFMLQRELKFRAIAVIDVLAYAVGSGVSIILALLDWGPWALVIGYVVETGLDSAITMVICPPPGRARLRWAALRDLLGFGGGQTAAGIANYFATQGDYIVVGRRLDAALLGVYTRAYELMRFPSMVFSNVAGGVLFSSFARLQDDPVRLGQAFRRVLFANAVILLPLSAGLIVLAPEAIRILIGPKWDSAVLPFQIMATSILWRTTHKASAIVARSAGDVWAIAFWQGAYAAAVIGGASVSVRWGIVGVACTTAAAVFFHFANLTRIALKRISIGWWGVITAHLDGFVLGGLAVAGAMPVAAALRALDARAAVIAIAATVAGAAPCAAYVIWRIRRRAEDWVWLLDRIKLIGKPRKGKGKGKNRQPETLAAPE